jgi:hypothetical protein
MDTTAVALSDECHPCFRNVAALIGDQILSIAQTMTPKQLARAKLDPFGFYIESDGRKMKPI